MKNRFMTRKLWIALTAGVVGCLLFASCRGDWNDHFDDNGSIPQENLMQVIKGDARLTLFGRILEKTGYDSLLTRDQTYTVWAPMNSALQNVEMNDRDGLIRLVSNHIARYSNPTSTAVGKGINMLNGKSLSYTSPSVFAGAALSEGDILARNGILHTLNDTIVYKSNLLEYISNREEYSNVYGFIKRFDEQKYDAGLSTTYDSVFVDYNPLLQSLVYGIGDIEDEDSLFTMILPDNAAWNAAYEHIKPYFTVYSKEQSYCDSVQEVQTSLAILGGLTFRGRLTEADSADSLLTVTGYTIHDAASYVSGYVKEEASNGMVYLANGNLNMADTSTWNLPIIVETEEMDGRVSLTGSNVYIRNTDMNSLVQGVSCSSYLEVSGSSVDPGVTFDIPNTLSGKYDIYVDFVAPKIDGWAFVAEKTRVQFQLKYKNSAGSTKTVNNREDALIVEAADSAHNIISIKAWEAVELPVSNYYDALWYLDEDNSIADVTVSTTLQVKTNVKNSELNKTLVRKFRIDRIRFVPVQDNSGNE